MTTNAKENLSEDAKHVDPTTKHYLNEESVRHFLRMHPEELEKHVMEEVDLELLERWIIRRTQRAKKPDKLNSCRKTSLSRWKFCVHADKRAMLQELTASLQEAPSELGVLEELSKCIASAVNADGHNLFLLGPNGLRLYTEDEMNEPTEKSSDDKKTAQLVASTRQSLRLSKREDQLWPAGSTLQIIFQCHIDHENQKNNLRIDRLCDGNYYSATSALYKCRLLTKQDEAYHSLFQPLSRSDGKLIGVIQLWKNARNLPFYEEDEEIVSSYLVWGGVAFHYAQLYSSVRTQRQLHEFLLQVVRSIFQDMVSTDVLVRKIIDFAQHLVQADRASLFLLDSETNELCAKVFDYGQGAGESPESDDSCPAREIRFPVGVGIAGHVAETKQLLNIPDAYDDPRFNRSVDQKTGYKTKSLLCMPIFQSSGNIIGVVQMVNKKTGTFTKDDEKAFEMFAVYCGLALHHADLFDKIKQSEQKYKVALEVLSYHSTCNDAEVNQVLPLPEKIANIERFDLNFMSISDVEKVRRAVYMFNDLFELSKFDLDCVIRFTLTVCKNYRRVPYHNWTHGFSVANTMYAIIKHSPGIFDQKECLALFIGALCHDLDHRGKDNRFMIESASPLANMYTTSTLEHHHFNQTVAILQQEGHNILQKLEREDYRKVLGIIKHCILATDLALFFKNKSKLSALISGENFTLSNDNHRSLVLAVAMTGSDLSASAKPWDIQLQTVRVIFQEFYEQGDEEKRAGRQPIPMMDRNQPEQQAASQVEFLTEICIPCYTLLAKVVPGSEPLLKQCQKNLERWKKMCECKDKNQDILGIAKIAVVK